MEYSNIDKKLFKNLESLIISPHLCFDEGIASYILDRLGEDKIREYKFSLSQFSSSNLGKVYTNTYGFISFMNNNEYAIGQKEIWEKIIGEKYPDILNHPKYEVKINDIPRNVSLGLLIALGDVCHWHKIQKENDNYKLSKEDIALLMLDFYENKRNIVSLEYRDKDDDLIKFLTDNTIENFDFIRKKMSKTQSSLLGFLIESEKFNVLMKKKPEKIIPLFKDNLNIIINKSSIKENIGKANMLSQALSIINKDIWKPYFIKKGKLDIISLCGKGLYFMSGYSVSKIEEMVKTKKGIPSSKFNKIKSINLEKEILTRLNFIKEDLHLVPEEDIEKLFLYASKIGQGFFLRGLIDFFGFPPKNENNIFLYKMLNSRQYEQKNPDNPNKYIKISFKEIEVEYYKKFLEEKLSISDKKPKLVKI